MFKNRFPENIKMDLIGKTIVESGKMYDYNVTYRVYSDNTVYVEGSGTLGFNLGDFRCDTQSRGILHHVIVDGSFTEVDDYAFGDWMSLESVLLPPTIETIKGRAFSDCDNLLYMKLPGTISNISNFAFMYTGLEEVEFYDNIPVRNYAEQYFRSKKIRMIHRGRLL